ncbi:MAG TPA: tRNA (adenosine(37)-N6)-threonylcarbamoyltransferase complex dimerization subunit type 1 TsaB [Candidatus Saccharimonadales bacterium]
MLILTIRTDKPEAEIGLFDGGTKIAYESWEAHRELSNTIHEKIRSMLKACDKEFKDMQGIACFQGPGSFTGLRIGITVADAFAYGLEIPIVAASGDDWIEQGIQRLQAGENDRVVVPHYGAPVHITQQRK